MRAMGITGSHSLLGVKPSGYRSQTTFCGPLHGLLTQSRIFPQINGPVEFYQIRWENCDENQIAPCICLSLLRFWDIDCR